MKHFTLKNKEIGQESHQYKCFVQRAIVYVDTVRAAEPAISNSPGKQKLFEVVRVQNS